MKWPSFSRFSFNRMSLGVLSFFPSKLPFTEKPFAGELYKDMFLLMLVLSAAIVQGQQNACSCSCCVGQFCVPTPLATLYVQSCTSDSCRAQCQLSYSQCQVSYPSGGISAQCTTTSAPQYNCQCNCCNTGSTSCVPFFVGNTIAYTCQTGACSISCAQQYPNQCVSNQNGQTQGSCIGLLTTTTTTTRASSIGWLGNSCTCKCCQSGSNCAPNLLGTTSASQCTLVACTQACQTQFGSSCPSLSYLGQTTGACANTGSGNTLCSCNCCSSTGCLNYNANSNGDCSTCTSVCQQQAICSNPYQVTYTCTANDAAAPNRFSFVWIIFAWMLLFSASFQPLLIHS